MQTQSSIKLGYHIRPANETDTNRIYSDWLRSYRQNSTTLKDLSEKIFFNEHRKVITDIIKRGKVLVLADKLDDYVVAGFICFEPQILHYIYIIKDFRKLGLATELMEAANFKRGQELLISHCVYSYAPVHFFKNYLAVFNPYKAYRNEI